MADPRFEDAIRRFEQAWRACNPIPIADALGESPDVDRLGLLRELVAIDLEYRWRSPDVAGTATLDAYADSFPELGPITHLPAELIAEEYRVRTRWGDRPTHAIYRARFPTDPDAVEQALRAVDAERESEVASHPPASHPPLAFVVDPDPDRVWHSHRDYLLRRLIGAGGMGKVFEAVHLHSGETVAVKFLRKRWSSHPGAVRRFLAEAHVVAQLDHPNIVATRGLGRTEAGGLFLVMDRVDGLDLARVVRDRPVSESEAVRWTTQLCEALIHAHDRGIIHCDLKPANLLLDPSGHVRVTDFGLARTLAEATPGAAEVEGTAPFLAPEQVARAWGPIDVRTDVHGVGAVLFALLTGRPPHPGRRVADILAGVVAGSPVASPATLRPDLSRPLCLICERCLRKPPAERYPTIRAVREALETLGSR